MEQLIIPIGTLAAVAIAQNSGEGKLWRVWQNKCHSSIFYPAKFPK